MKKPLRIYIAGPYSSDPEGNTRIATEVAAKIAIKGHYSFCPHLSHYPHLVAREMGHEIPYDYWLDMDLDLIRRWPNALLYLAPSPGADKEKALAESLGMFVFTSVDQIPSVE